MIIKPVNTFMSQPQFRKWSDTLGGITKETWAGTFDNLYKTTNHMKLIQHQYKILTMIATSKYMRYNMKINSSFNCAQCHPGSVETLEHIYIECPKHDIFFKRVDDFIKNFIEPNYSSNRKIYRLICSHSCKTINFLNVVANWYVGRKVQHDKQLHWDEFNKYMNIFLEGERIAVVA